MDEEAADMQQQMGNADGDAPGGYGAQQQQPQQYAPHMHQHQEQLPERAAAADNDMMEIRGLLVGMANRQNETERIMAAAAAVQTQQQQGGTAPEQMHQQPPQVPQIPAGQIPAQAVFPPQMQPAMPDMHPALHTFAAEEAQRTAHQA
eukprot:1861828-Pyramimonas_sp.AAC.1